MSQIVTTPDGQRHTFPDEATPEQIKAALASYVKPQSIPTPTMTAQNNPFAAYMNKVKGNALGALPVVGGAIGGLAGGGEGPVAIGGAAAGGAIGEGARQVLSGEPLSGGKIAKRGGEQGAYQAVGGVIAKGASAAARPLMRRAMGVGKTIAQDFPNAVETALSKGIPVSEKGALKATALREESSRALYDLLNNAKAQGTTFRMSDVTKPVKALIRDPVLPDREKARILTRLRDFMAQHGQTMDPVLLKEIKQFYQNRAQNVFKAEGRGALTLAQENRGLFSRELSRGAKQQLETIPGVAAQETNTQSLIGAERAVHDAVTRPPRPFELMHPGSWPVVSSANNPNLTSNIAIRLADPQWQAMLKQSPRLAAQLLASLMYTDQPDQIGGGTP